MKVFVYDRTFEGLLSVVFDAFTMKHFPKELYGPDDVFPLTATEVHTVMVTAEKPARVFTALKKKLSPFTVRSMLYTWLSEQPGSDAALFRFMCKVLQSKKSIENDMADPDVWEVVRLRRKVGKEVERFSGFVRFQKTKEDIYFSAIAPKYNVLPLLLDLFADRLWDQHWIIYDAVRHYGIMHKNGDFEEIFLDERRLKNGFLREEFLAQGEELLESLWRTYYDSVNIAQRKNLRLQRNFMPKRFWKYLTEKREPQPGKNEMEDL